MCCTKGERLLYVMESKNAYKRERFKEFFEMDIETENRILIVTI